MSDAGKSDADLAAELAAANSEIDRAYWSFTRQARAKPPSMVCPHAYQRRSEIQAELRRRRTTERR